jgi:hypothetical protein
VNQRICCTELDVQSYWSIVVEWAVVRRVVVVVEESRITQHSLVTTRLKITSQHHGETRKSRSNRSMSLKGKKSSIVVLWVEGSY